MPLSTTPERQLQKLVVEYEKFQRERLPVCTHERGELVETSCTIMDLKNVGVGQFWKVSVWRSAARCVLLLSVRRATGVHVRAAGVQHRPALLPGDDGCVLASLLRSCPC